MKYVLDTNTVSFLMRGDPTVARELTSRRRTDVLLPQPVVAEIEYGLQRLPRSARRTRLRKRLDVYLNELLRADWTDEVSRAFGSIKADLERRGIPIEDFDVAVAAHAVAMEATLVTDNIDHMNRVRDLQVESWRS
ncbi:MAG: PIN domain-containing protein [Acidobacteriota bacterium]